MIQPCFQFAHNFHDGVARVNFDGKERLLDLNGEAIFQCSNSEESIGYLQAGTGIIYRGEMPNYTGYYIDLAGNRLSDDSMNAYLGFGDGLGVVWQRPDGRWKYGYINKSGQIELPLRFRSARPFQEGIAVVGLPEPGTTALIDKFGNVLSKTDFAVVEDVRNGLSRVRGNRTDPSLSRGKWGYMNVHGDLVIDLKFDQVANFREIPS